LGTYTSAVIITAFDLVDYATSWYYSAFASFSTTFQAASVNLAQLFGYGFSPNGATVTLQLSALYADGTIAVLWSVNTSTLFGFGLPQRAFQLNSAKSVSALQFSSPSAIPALFYVDPHMSQLLFASGSRNDGDDGLPDRLDNFDVATAKRTTVRARRASLDADGLLPAAATAVVSKNAKFRRSAETAVIRQRQSVARRDAAMAEPGSREAAAAGSAASLYIRKPSLSSSSSSSSSSTSSTSSSDSSSQANATRTPRRRLPPTQHVHRRRPRPQSRRPSSYAG
jgi:hypothetical protein